MSATIFLHSTINRTCLMAYWRQLFTIVIGLPGILVKPGICLRAAGTWPVCTYLGACLRHATDPKKLDATLLLTTLILYTSFNTISLHLLLVRFALVVFVRLRRTPWAFRSGLETLVQSLPLSRLLFRPQRPAHRSSRSSASIYSSLGSGGISNTITILIQQHYY